MYNRVYYCFCGDNCKFETMTKEQIITAIYQAIKDGGVSNLNIDAGFITKVKEINKDETLNFWVGTTAEFKELEKTSPSFTKNPNVFFIKTDDTTLADFAEQIEEIQRNVESSIETFAEELNKTRVYDDFSEFHATKILIHGIVKNNDSVLSLFLPLSKPVVVDTVSFETLAILVAGISGRIGGGALTICKNQLTYDPYLVETTIVDNGIIIDVHNTTGSFSGATALTPIVAQANIDILFTKSEI